MAPIPTRAKEVMSDIGPKALSSPHPVSRKELIETVISNAPVVFFALDEKGVFTLSEGQGLSALGRSAGEVVGKSIFDVYSDNPTIIRHIQRVLDGEEFSGEISVGNLVFESRYFPIRGVEGQISGVIGVSTDISKRIKAESSLAQSLSLLQASLEATNDGVLVVDTNGKIISFNKKFLQMWRIPSSVVDSEDDSKALDYVLPQLQDPDQFMSKVSDLYTNLNTESFDVLHFKDGRVFERSSRPQRLEGKTVGRVWSFRDVTSRVKADNAVSYRIQFEKLITTLSTTLMRLGLQEIEKGIDDGLSSLRAFTGVDLSYICLLSEEGDSASMVYEQRAGDVPSLYNRCQEMKAETFPWWVERLNKLEAIHLPYSDKLPPEALSEQLLLKEEGIKSCIAVPMLFGQEIMGFLGFASFREERTWKNDDIALLRIVGEVFAGAIERKKSDQKMRRRLAQTQTLRQVVEQLNCAETLEEVNQITVSGAMKIFGADRASILCYDADDTMRFKQSINLSSEYMAAVEGYSPWEKHDVSAKPIWYGSIKKSSLDAETRRVVLEEGISSIGIFPLIAENSLLGRFSVYYNEPHMFSEVTINIGKVLADNATASLRRLSSQNALRLSEERYRQFFEENLSGYFIADPHGELLACNPAFAQILGFDSVADALNRSFLAFFNSSDEVDEFLSLLQHKQQLTYYDLTLNHTSGRALSVVMSAHTTMNSAGELAEIKGFIFDNTRRRHAEEELRRSQQMLQSVIGNIPQLVFWKDSNFVYLGCNKAFAQIAGLKRPEDIIGKTDYDMPWSKEEADISRKRDMFVVNHKTPQYHTEESHLGIGGRVTWFDSNRIPLYDKNGEVMGILGAYEDITERKAVDERLRHHAALLDITGDAIIVQDLDGKVIFWNKGAEALYGWPTNETVGKQLSSVLHCEMEAKTEPRHGLLQKHGRWAGELQQKTRDGKEIMVDSRWTLIEDDQKAAKSILVVNTDVTDKLKYEAEMLRASKLESLGLLAGGIAHDFNNLLTAILGNLSLALLSCDGDEKLNRYLSNAEKASIRTKDLIQQLLTFARGGAPIKSTASVSDTVKETVIFTLRGSNCKCDFNFSEELWSAEFDVAQISRVIDNIVINAKQAMPDGGLIKVSCENTIVAPGILPVGSGRYVKISIVDEGFGIPAEKVSQIFDPYYTTKPKGSGLGLATSYSIISKHAGHIEVDSVEGVGTAFSFYLPASDGEPEIDVESSRQPKLGKGRLLVMDDEEMVRETAEVMLSSIGYDVDLAPNGSEAIKTYKKAIKRKEPYLAVIMDLTVPGDLGGKETLRRLIKIDPQVKAIVSSGYSNDPVMGNFADYGFSGVVAKPYHVRELSDVLYNVLKT